MKLPVPPLGPLSGLLYYWLCQVCTGPARLSVSDFLAMLNHSAKEVHSFCELPIRRNNLLGELQFFPHIFPNSGFGIVLLSTSRSIRVEVFSLATENSYLDDSWMPTIWQFPPLNPLFRNPDSSHKSRIITPLSCVTSPS